MCIMMGVQTPISAKFLTFGPSYLASSSVALLSLCALLDCHAGLQRIRCILSLEVLNLKLYLHQHPQYQCQRLTKKSRQQRCCHLSSLL